MRGTSINSNVGLIAGVVTALLCAGCASSDLSQNADATGDVVACLPTDAPAPAVVARAIWYQNARGFGSTDESALGHVTGVIALAGESLYFMEWNDPERHYDMLKVIDVPSITTMRVDRFGGAAMLVVESGHLTFDSFELMNKGQFGSDPQATQALYDKLTALQAKKRPSYPQ
jgi:hypothetical protein